VARLMTRKHIHRVIVRKGRSVAGIISALDVLRVHGVPSGAASKNKKKKKTTTKTRMKSKTRRRRALASTR
jgi:signal-transduction protein with cAMP-binding, CBS, and nucleotidyltransferase domain